MKTRDKIICTECGQHQAAYRITLNGDEIDACQPCRMLLMTSAKGIYSEDRIIYR